MSSKNSRASAKAKNEANRQHTAPVKDDPRMPMERQNYILMAIGFAVIVLGFALMTGGGDNDPNVFDADKLFSFRRITLAPILVLGGFAFEIYAIMKKPKAKKEEE